jgi:hypothetical protein
MGRGSRKENEINQHPRLTELYHICSISCYQLLPGQSPSSLVHQPNSYISAGRDGITLPAARRSGRPEAPSVIQGSWHLRRASGLGLHGTRSRFRSRSARGVYSPPSFTRNIYQTRNVSITARRQNIYNSNVIFLRCQ